MRMHTHAWTHASIQTHISLLGYIGAYILVSSSSSSSSSHFILHSVWSCARANENRIHTLLHMQNSWAYKFSFYILPFSLILRAPTRTKPHQFSSSSTNSATFSASSMIPYTIIVLMLIWCACVFRPQVWYHILLMCCVCVFRPQVIKYVKSVIKYVPLIWTYV